MSDWNDWTTLALTVQAIIKWVIILANAGLTWQLWKRRGEQG